MNFDKVNAEEILQKLRQRVVRKAVVESSGGDSDLLKKLEEQIFGELSFLQEIQDPTRLPPGVRFRLMKRIVQRILRTYTRGQVQFNQTLIRTINSLTGKTCEVVEHLNSLTQQIDAIRNDVGRLGDQVKMLKETQDKRISDLETMRQLFLTEKAEVYKHLSQETRFLNERIDDEKKGIFGALEEVKNLLASKLDEEESKLHNQIASEIQDVNRRIDDEKTGILEGIESVKQALDARIGAEKELLHDRLGQTLETIHKRIDDEKSGFFDALEAVKTLLSSRLDEEKSKLHDRLASKIQDVNRRIDDEKTGIFEGIELVKKALDARIETEKELLHDRLGKTIKTIHKRIDDEKKGILKSVPDFGTLDQKTQEAKEYASRLAESLDAEIKTLIEKVTPRNIFNMFQAQNDINDHTYFNLEEHFRGSEEALKERQNFYLSLLAEHHTSLGGRSGHYLDVGCGRGELLSLLKKNKIPAKGVDINYSMVEHCKKQGLAVRQTDLLEYLKGLRDKTLRGVLALQVIEHLSIRDMYDFFALSYEKLKPGGIFILETVNPGSVYALRWFYLDYTHNKPLPAPMIEFLLNTLGYRDVDVILRSPVEGWKQLSIPEGQKSLDENFHKLNNFLFGYQDYTIRAFK